MRTRVPLSLLATLLSTVGLVAGPAAGPALASTPVVHWQGRMGGPAAGKPQNEISIAVNPSNKDNVVAGANDYRPNGGVAYFVTKHGGADWTNAILPMAAGVTSFSDPVVRFNRDGSAVYLAQLGQESTGAVAPCDPKSGIYFHKSTDGGSSWSNGSPVAPNGPTLFNDKPWLTDDRSTGITGKSGMVYVTYTKFMFATPTDCKNGVSSTSPIQIRHSIDQGQTWSSEVSVAPTFTDAQGSAVTVRPNGDVFVALIATCPGPGNHQCLVVSKSTDGAQTFTTTTVAQITQTDVLTVGPSESVRADSFPSIASDGAGNLYVVWNEARIGTTSGVDVYFSKSSNGTTWSSPRRVNTVGTNDQFFPFVAVDSNDVVWVSFSDRRDDPKNITYRQYVAHSHDGGTTWEDLPVADTASDPRAVRFTGGQMFIGDYNTMDVIPGGLGVWLSWCDTRNSVKTDGTNGEEDAFAARVDALGSSASVTLSVDPAEPRVWGTTFSLAGTLTEAGAAAVGKAVQVQTRAPGTQVWRNLGSPVTTDGSGHYSVSLNNQAGHVKPAQNTEVRVISLGGGGALGAQSPTRLIQVRVGITLTSAESKRRPGQLAHFSGTISPAHARKKVYLQQLSNHGWVTIQTVSLDSHSQFNATASMRASGFRMFRVIFPTQDGDHVWNVSRSVGVRWS
ncbi:MAG: hypothetical protein NVSMB57_14340 [Actinomycetota bacterium]